MVAHRTWAWIETPRASRVVLHGMTSPTVRGRGLKLPAMPAPSAIHRASPTVRGRGLKHIAGHVNFSRNFVAHRTWAWIETLVDSLFPQIFKRRPPYVGVD